VTTSYLTAKLLQNDIESVKLPSKKSPNSSALTGKEGLQLDFGKIKKRMRRVSQFLNSKSKFDIRL
jgi:hypothetical protein